MWLLGRKLEGQRCCLQIAPKSESTYIPIKSFKKIFQTKQKWSKTYFSISTVTHAGFELLHDSLSHHCEDHYQETMSQAIY